MKLEFVSQYLVPNRLGAVYNIEVGDFPTYHVGKLRTWVHNAIVVILMLVVLFMAVRGYQSVDLLKQELKKW